MEHRNLLPPLAEQPRDAHVPGEQLDADEVIYRLGLRSVEVLGAPDLLTIDDVEIEFMHGPVRAQRTEMRQRPGLPVEFDKSMQRYDVGANERIVVLSIRSSPVPGDLDTAFGRWRGRALAAAGLLAAILDERMVHDEIFEDAVLLRGGEALGAVDMRARVRTYLPLEVRSSDGEALARLSELTLSESSAVARAARLYRRATIEGPTADAYAMLWVAAECFSEKRSPSKKEIESTLEAEGVDLASLPVSVGLLLDLRGKIQHHGLEEHDDLPVAFYEMEAVVRALIRQRGEIDGGWPLAANNPAAYSDPFDSAIEALQTRGATIWHEGGLPAPISPSEENLPRRVANPIDDARIEIDSNFGEASELIASIVADAIEWNDPEQHLFVKLGLPDLAPEWAESLATNEGIYLSDSSIDGVMDSERPEVVVNLVWDLHGQVAEVFVQRAGVRSEGEGAAVVEAVGAWSQYRRLITFGEFNSSLLVIPTDDGLKSVGKLAGWAAAGDASAREALENLGGERRRLARELAEALESNPPGISDHALVITEGIRSIGQA